MVRAGWRRYVCPLSSWLVVCLALHAQMPELVTTGQIVVDGRSTPYRIRHLPVTSFPDMPEAFASLLNRRGTR